MPRRRSPRRLRLPSGHRWTKPICKRVSPEVRRAPEPDDADGYASLHAACDWVLKKVSTQSHLSHCTSCLQLRAYPQDAARDARVGRWKRSRSSPTSRRSLAHAPKARSRRTEAACLVPTEKAVMGFEVGKMPSFLGRPTLFKKRMRQYRSAD